MSKLPDKTDFVVVGAGIAGLRAAIELAPAGRVLLLSKQQVSESATQYAQGGIAVALSDDDEIALHLQDTIDAGDGLVNVDAATVLVEEGPDRILELIEWGTNFDREGTKLTFTREGAHSVSRILHAHGDSTGQEIGRALAAKARALSNIDFCEFAFTADLLVSEGRISGIVLLGEDGRQYAVSASAVLLASGGAGQVYSETTNPSVATGDGTAIAYRAGAVLSDTEFFQFHPTALYVPGAPRFLLSEALRGEGAYLLDPTGRRFMSQYHTLEELAPRDVVARAIASELAKSTEPDPAVYLDVRHLPAEKLKSRFPRIYSTCLKYGVDITSQPIPIRPAAHYFMGGVKTDLHGKSSLGRLYAAGETACTGVHGANRLASNSLLEGLVFGARAGAAMKEESLQPANGNEKRLILPSRGVVKNVEPWIKELRQLMWKNVGIVRSAQSLKAAISFIAQRLPDLAAPGTRRAFEALNLHQTAILIARAALAREESRGAHFRRDFPQREDATFRKHSIQREDAISFAE